MRKYNEIEKQRESYARERKENKELQRKRKLNKRKNAPLRPRADKLQNNL